MSIDYRPWTKNHIYGLSTMDYGLKILPLQCKTFYRFQRLVWERKVRATQSILLPNGKAPAAGDSKCHRK